MDSINEFGDYYIGSFADFKKLSEFIRNHLKTFRIAVKNEYDKRKTLNRNKI